MMLLSTRRSRLSIPPCAEADWLFHVGSVTHTKQMFSCKVANRWRINDLNCKIDIAVFCEVSEWLRNVHL